MGMFSGIDKAKSAEGGVYPVPGVFDLEVVALKAGKTRAGKNFFVAEFEILASSVQDARPVGSLMSWMVMIDPAYLDTALGNIKGFLSVLTGIPHAKIDEAGVEDAVSAGNPCKGMRVRAAFNNIKTKAGKDFTKATWVCNLDTATAEAAG